MSGLRRNVAVLLAGVLAQWSGVPETSAREHVPMPPPPKPATPPEVEAYRAERQRRKRENWLKRQPKEKH